jgi:hypothetical protein
MAWIARCSAARRGCDWLWAVALRMPGSFATSRCGSSDFRFRSGTARAFALSLPERLAMQVGLCILLSLGAFQAADVRRVCALLTTQALQSLERSKQIPVTSTQTFLRHYGRRLLSQTATAYAPISFQIQRQVGSGKKIRDGSRDEFQQRLVAGEVNDGHLGLALPL